MLFYVVNIRYILIKYIIYNNKALLIFICWYELLLLINPYSPAITSPDVMNNPWSRVSHLNLSIKALFSESISQG